VYYPILMKGEWPVLLDFMGKGEGDERYLSVAEVKTLFVERRFPGPDRRAIAAALRPSCHLKQKTAACPGTKRQTRQIARR